MFFFLSKTLNYLTQPLVIIILLVVISFFIRKERVKRWLRIGSFVLLALMSNQFLANEAIRAWEPRIMAFSELKKKYDYGILLTGIAKANVGPDDRVYFARGADRATHTLQLYKLGYIRKIIISGGSGRLIDIGVREAEQLAAFFEMAGVPKEDVIIENQANNTYQNAIEVKRIVDQLEGPKELLVITSAFHIPRSMACFRKAGVAADAFPTDPQAFDRTFRFDVLIIPKLEAMGVWQTLFKEWVGFVAYKVAGYI